MNPQDVLSFYECILSTFHELDRMYYSDPNPSPIQRAAYYQRQAMTDALRDQLYLAMDGAEGPFVENPDTFRILVNHSPGLATLSEPKCRLQHDLNNCLHVILASTELLSARLANDSEALGRIHHITRTVHRMKERINRSRCRIVQDRTVVLGNH